MATTVWEYFEERERECRDLSLGEDPQYSVYAEEAGSDGKRGRWIARLHLDDEVFLHCSEVVEVHDGYVHRLEYGYFLVIRGVEYWGRERDPTHDPPEHGHGLGHSHQAAGPMSFKDAATEAWSIHSAEAELADARPDDEA